MFDFNQLLKTTKVPFWARWSGRYKAYQRRKLAYKEIHYITTVYSWVIWSNTGRRSKRWYILKVDGTGRRFFEYGSDDPYLKDHKDDSEYARIIAPWVYGRYTNEQMKVYGPKTERQQNA